jgi:hypothetical protein
MLYATPEFISAVIALPLARMKSSAFHRRLTERLLPEWTGIDYVQDVGVAERIPHIWDGDGLDLLTQLSDGTTAELTWMLDHNKVRTALDRLRRGELDAKQVSPANRLLTTRGTCRGRARLRRAQRRTRRRRLALSGCDYLGDDEGLPWTNDSRVITRQSSGFSTSARNDRPLLPPTVASSMT